MASQRSLSELLRKSRKNVGFPDTEENFKQLVYAGEFRSLANDFAGGRLAKFEEHPFMRRVVEHALLDVPPPVLEIKSELAGNLIEIALSGTWPDDLRINAAYWAIASGRQNESRGIIDRRAGDSGLSEIIRVSLSPRLDIHLVFGIRTRNDVFAGSSHHFRVRENFKYEGEFEFIDHIEDELIEIKEFVIPSRRNLLSTASRVLGLLGVAVGVALLLMR
jgi:hypothetical protein